MVEYIRSEGIGVVVDSLAADYPEDLFAQLDACRDALTKVRHHPRTPSVGGCAPLPLSTSLLTVVCPPPLLQVRNHAVFEVAAACQEAVRRARTGLAAAPEEPAASTSDALQSRVSTLESLPWDQIVTHLTAVNEDTVSGRHVHRDSRPSSAADGGMTCTTPLRARARRISSPELLKKAKAGT